MEPPEVSAALLIANFSRAQCRELLAGNMVWLRLLRRALRHRSYVELSIAVIAMLSLARDIPPGPQK
jgi:hypothetical protein